MLPQIIDSLPNEIQQTIGTIPSLVLVELEFVESKWNKPHVWIGLIKFLLVVDVSQFHQYCLLREALVFGLYDIIDEMANLFENDLGPKSWQQLDEVAHVGFPQ